MTVPSPAIIVAAAAAIGLAFIAWILYELLPEKVCLRNQTIVKEYRGKSEQMRISDVSEIKYHYHAVAGFVATWEFIDKNANSLAVAAEAKGVADVLGSLEKFLPSFSLTEFKRKFDEGDVVDTIDVWKAA